MAATSSQLGRHIYGHSTIDGSAQVQLGDVNSYTYNYSILDARNAIYKNTLTLTLREVLSHKSLAGRFAMFPASKMFTLPWHESIALQIDTLEKYLSSMQEIEQRHIRVTQSFSSRSPMFENALADTKVTNCIAATNMLLSKLLKLAKSRCTSPGQVSCLDDFCDLVDRLGMQIAARLSLDKAVEHLPSNTVETQDDLQQFSTLASTVSDPNDTSSFTPRLSAEESVAVAGSLEDQEYLYATQDFWRQLALVLKKMLQIHSRSWLEPLKLLALMIFVYSLLFYWIGILTSDGRGTSEAFRIYHNLLPVVMAIWVMLTLWIARRTRARNRKFGHVPNPSTS